ncbi:MAG: hypothetical protein WCB18_05765 [Thermoplasmata archaeon]
MPHPLDDRGVVGALYQTAESAALLLRELADPQHGEEASPPPGKYLR